MIPRKLEPKLRELAGYYPVVVVTGPRQSGNPAIRQSGKTTLCQAVFPDRPCVSMEALDTRESGGVARFSQRSGRFVYRTLARRLSPHLYLTAVQV